MLNNSKYSEDDMATILESFLNRKSDYEHVAREIANTVAGCSGVHSVRFRVKEPHSLCKKILDKDSSVRDKITPENLSSEISDLIGVRALYLYASDYIDVHRSLKECFPAESFFGDPCINYREGDDLTLFDQIDKNRRKDNPGVYRSIHYILNTINLGTGNINNLKARAEIQIRTIYEEGWSEMNHRAYKGDTKGDKVIIKSLSSILSRLVGTCNELGVLMKQCDTSRERLSVSPEEKKILDAFNKIMRN